MQDVIGFRGLPPPSAEEIRRFRLMRARRELYQARDVYVEAVRLLGAANRSMSGTPPEDREHRNWFRSRAKIAAWKFFNTARRRLTAAERALEGM